MSSDPASELGWLRFSRTGMVRLSKYGPDPIGRVVETTRRGPRGGEFSVYDWKPNCSAPPHLQGHINQCVRMRGIHHDLIMAHAAFVEKQTRAA